jgi:uncharacterized protein (DUF1501 family)
MNRSRRRFLQSSGLGLLALGLPPGFLARAAAAQERDNGKVLVVVFQRGGMDGLNVVVPFKDPAYYSLRPTIAVPEPGAGEARALDLDGFYSLHPALAPLKPIYDRGELAIVQASGSPDTTRSHFDAQDYMEIGTPGIKSTPDGWLNRCAGERSAGVSPFSAVALTPQLPRILAGAAPALTVSSIDAFRLRREALASALKNVYAGSGDALLRLQSEHLFGAISELQRVVGKIPAPGETYPPGPFGAGLAQIARLIKAGLGTKIAFTEIGGWDTHSNEGGATGQLANHLKIFADGLAAFHRDLGNRMADVVVLTLSEFGRTARENGNGGTDHGHGNVMFIMGGALRGGKVYGRWPGLAPEVLYEGRDLDVTTDFRSVCSEVISGHLGRRDLGKVFPGYRPAPPLGLLV